MQAFGITSVASAASSGHESPSVYKHSNWRLLTSLQLGKGFPSAQSGLHMRDSFHTRQEIQVKISGTLFSAFLS